MRFVFLTSVVVFVLAGTAIADEPVNPAFASWSKFKPGTAVTTKFSRVIGGFTMGMTSATTLREVGADKLVLETSGTVRLNDQEGGFEPVRSTVTKATSEKDAKDDARAGGKPEGTFEEGTETLTVGEAKTKVEARWYKFKSEADGVKTEGKVWVSAAVPGGVVRQELTRASGAVTERQTTEVVEIKTP